MAQKYYIPTYDEAKDIVNKTGGVLFYELVKVVDGYKVCLFNYKFGRYKSFVEHNAFEMRGLCFVFNQNDTLFKRYILMHKFFNLNEVAETNLNLVKDIPFKAIHDKADGSIISFIRLPNGKIFAKSKMSLIDSDQAKLAQDIYERNLSLKNLVKYTLDNDITAIFELVSPDNQIVLKYPHDDLILLRLRNNNTGEYLELDCVKDYLNGVRVVQTELNLYSNWEELLAAHENVTDKEGWVVTLPNLFIKVKTKWYNNLHRVITTSADRENDIIELILDEKIDDLLGQLSENSIRKIELIEKAQNYVQNFMTENVREINKMIDEYNNVFNKNKKDFAIKYSKHSLFGLAIKATMNEKSVNELVAEYLKMRTKNLQKAREFIETGKLC